MKIGVRKAKILEYEERYSTLVGLETILTSKITSISLHNGASSTDIPKSIISLIVECIKFKLSMERVAIKKLLMEIEE